MNILDSILLAVVFTIIVLCSKNLSKEYISSFIIHRVRWIKSNMNVDYFVKKERNLVDEKYFILCQDEPYIEEIISEFIDYMLGFTLREDMPYKKEYRKLSLEEYAMIYLVHFLATTEKKRVFRKKATECTMQDDMTRVYTLTDYGYAFYRIYHIAVTYCNKSEKILRYVGSFCDVQVYLDNGTIDF